MTFFSHRPVSSMTFSLSHRTVTFFNDTWYRRRCRLFLPIPITSGGSRGANPAMTPPSKLAMEFGPLGGRNTNGRIVNLCKFKDFGPPNRSENQYIKTRKESMTKKRKRKKGRQKFWEIDEIFSGNANIFSGNA